MDPLSPEGRGARTLNATLDRWRKVKPDKVFASVLRSPNVADGFDDVTMRDIANASDAFAWWLTDTLGTSISFETLAYVGLNDLRYAIFLYGASKAGYKSLFVSPRNPPAQNASLLEQMHCKRFFHATETLPVVQAVLNLLPDVQGASVGPLTHWISTFIRPYPYTKAFEDAKHDPIVVLHSSGSTGPPKPVTLSQGYFAAADMPLSHIPGREPAGKAAFNFPGGGFFYCPFPFFHLAGLTAVCMYPVTAMETSAVIALADRPPTPPLIKQIIDAKSLRALYSPPSLVEAITHLDGGMDSLGSLEIICYSGGPMSPDCGNKLVKKVKLTTIYGATETGASHMLIPHPDDWNYFEFHPDFKITMDPAIDGLSELVFRWDGDKDKDAAKSGIYWSYRFLKDFRDTYPREYRTRDLFKPHPIKAGLWTFNARNDDIIVFANGAKYNPVPAENVLLGNPLLSGALILGDGRTQAAALVEPKEAPSAPEALLDQLWPTVDKANAQSQKQGRLARHMIAVIEPGSTVRAPKGTVVRKMTIDKFRSQIGHLYDNGPIKTGGLTPAVLHSAHEAIYVTRCCVHAVDHLAAISDHDDFYVRGLDSVQTIEMTQILRTALSLHYGELSWLTGQLVFENPTIESLGTAIARKLDLLDTVSSAEPTLSRPELINALVAKYSGRVPGRALNTVAKNEASSKSAQTVLLTGATGFLGLRVLQASLAAPDVEHIHCLNRGADASLRILDVLSSRPDLAEARKKLTFHTAQLADANLGLDAAAYKMLTQRVDTIIHNAWKIDFNHSLESFEAVHLAGVAHLLVLAGQCAHPPHFVFISSIGAVSSLAALDGAASPTPEAVVFNARAPAPMGYGQSKHVAERVLATAAPRIALTATILRLGQVAGAAASPDAGPHWNPAEWLPALLFSSKALACLPAWLPDADWVPVDTAGAAVTQLALHGAAPAGAGAQVFHVMNTRTTPWAKIVPRVQARFGGSTACPVVPFATWVERVRNVDLHDAAAMKRVPARKILAYFEALLLRETSGQAAYDVRRAATASEAIRDLTAVKPEWMDAWMDAWGL